MKQFKLTIVYNPYDRYTSGPGRTKTYTGRDELSVLKKIINNHGYGVECAEDELEEGQPLTARLVWKNIRSMNGDGCDYISAFFIGKSTKYKGPKGK